MTTWSSVIGTGLGSSARADGLAEAGEELDDGGVGPTEADLVGAVAEADVGRDVGLPPAQAQRVRDNLSRFQAPGGLLTSTRVTGHQWDAPFGWAPLQMITVGGLRRYGYDEDADRIARKFIGVVIKEFEEHGVILEKYDGGPVGLSTLAVAVGEEPGTIEEVYEPYLIQEGFLQRTPRGREATPLAYKHFGVDRKAGRQDGLF